MKSLQRIKFFIIKPMNILIIDDHFSTRTGISDLLHQLYPEIIIHESGSVAEGLNMARRLLPDLVLLDIQLPVLDGMEGLRMFRREFPSLRVVMFSGFDDRDRVFEALKLGAMGFIPKSLPRLDFVEAIRDVLLGEVFLPPSVLVDRPIKGGKRQPRSSGNCDSASLGLTGREFEVLGWVVQGKPYKEIAENLGIQEQTVRNHLRPIFQKFGVSRRVDLMLLVAERGLVFGPPKVGD
jgi:DNA-binding NarL/FixJ family response regulator